MLIIVNFFDNFCNFSKVASFGEVDEGGSGEVDVIEVFVGNSGSEFDKGIGTGFGLGSVKSGEDCDISKNSGSCNELKVELFFGEVGGDEAGDEAADKTGEVIISFGTSTFLEVSKTKNASPPSPSFIGKFVNLPFIIKSTFF